MAKIEPKKGEKHVHGRRFLHATNFGEFSRSPMLNPADILSKAWGYQQVWIMLKALLFWEGDTIDIE